MIEVLNRPTMKLKFEFRANSIGVALPVKVQHDLLEPFGKLRGEKQTTQIGGVVDSHLGQDMASRLTPRLHWAQTRFWEFYDIVEHNKKFADSLVVNRPINAFVQYVHSLRLAYAATTEEMFATTDDFSLHDNFIVMNSNITLWAAKYALIIELPSINLAKPGIRAAVSRDRTLVKKRTDLFLVNSVQSAYYDLWTGLCLLVLSDDPTPGLAVIKSAAKACPDFSADIEAGPDIRKKTCQCRVLHKQDEGSGERGNQADATLPKGDWTPIQAANGSQCS